jgi:DNA-binding MarR family transcriptional regulator
MAQATRWLSDDEQAAWRAFMLVTHLLDDALDRQLQRDADMPHAYYGILAALSEAPGATLRMSDLARMLRYSPSRLTHAVARLEDRGWVTRRRCPTDGRGQLAGLTAGGLRALTTAAPGHVREVRARVFDRLSGDQVTQLRAICDTLLTGLDVTAGDRPC